MSDAAQIKPISVTVKKAVEITGLGERTIRARISTGEIPSNLIAGRRLVLYEGLEKFIKGEINGCKS